MENFKIERLDHQGRGITHVNNKIAFVENALPDEEVTLLITKENKKIIEAKVDKYLKFSEKRVESKCPYYNECGGCDIMHISYMDQLDYKTKKIKDIISRYTTLNDSIINDIIPSPKQYHYRNKITLKVDNNIGYYKKKSYQIIPIDSCLLANNKINEAIKFLSKINMGKNFLELVLRSINETSLSLTIYLQNESKVDDFIKKIESFFDEITVVYENKPIYIKGNGNIIGKLDNFEFTMSPSSFFQVNTLQTINLYNQIKSYVKEMDMPTVLDLYCGTGTIGIYISKYAKKIIGVEINSGAIENAKVNAKNNTVENIEFFTGDTKMILNQHNLKAELVIVDPPRSGLDKEVIDDLIKINPKMIIYVSCDPMTLARDLELFNTEYNIKEITPFDMFPNTAHVETVSLLLRRP